MTRVQKSWKHTKIEMVFWTVLVVLAAWYGTHTAMWIFIALGLLSVILHTERMAAERYYLKEQKEKPEAA